MERYERTTAESKLTAWLQEVVLFSPPDRDLVKDPSFEYLVVEFKY